MMSLPWYFHERLANNHHAELLREAYDARRAKEARGDRVDSPILPRVFSWLGEQAGALRKQSEALAGKSQTLASQKLSYLDNPDPFKDCVTC